MVLIGGNPESIIEGFFSREKDGAITLDDFSGHFHQNWTLEKAKKLTDFLEKKTGEKINIRYIGNIPPAK